jgi:hypothetical protein
LSGVASWTAYHRRVKLADQEHPPLPRRDERRRKADETEREERRAETWPQTFAEMEQVPGEPERQRHVMAQHRMRKLEIHAPPPAVNPSDRRQHEEEKGADRNAGDGCGPQPPPFRPRRSDDQNGDDGEGQDQRADIFRACG